jgi:uncharacterized coiled-coil DUF342 family protein
MVMRINDSDPDRVKFEELHGKLDEHRIATGEIHELVAKLHERLDFVHARWDALDDKITELLGLAKEPRAAPNEPESLKAIAPPAPSPAPEPPQNV